MSTQSSDVYSIYMQNVQKYFESVSKMTPQYFQSMTDFQDEYMKVCEKTISASVSVQQEIAAKTGIKTDVPDATKTVLVDMNKQIVKTYTMNNQFVKTVVGTTIQNIETYADNTNAFVELNKNMIQSWMTPFALKN